MTAALASSLSSDALARRLTELAGQERQVVVEFLLHLDEFDRRRAWAEAGHDSLWSYCQRVLHLREGPAGRRIGAMRVLRRFPVLADALRDGRLCLSTVTVLASVLSDQNLEDVLARAAYRTKAEVEHVVATLQPREAPLEGVRRLSPRPASARVEDQPPARHAEPPVQHTAAAPVLFAERPTEANPKPARPSIQPVDAGTYSLRVTVDASLKAELDELTALLSHKVPRGELAEVLREAIRCAIEKHGNRKGARAPAQERRREGANAPPQDAAGNAAPDGVFAESRAGGRQHVPAHVRREVWARDGGRCTWLGPDGQRCESRWKLELDHVRPVALGGTSDAANLRLLCRAHNRLHAERVFGADHIARFAGDGPGQVRLLIPG